MKKEILTVNVKIDDTYGVKGAKSDAFMILFSGTFKCEYMEGIILPGGVDTQTTKHGENTMLSARYMLKGMVDETEYHIFVENNGECKEEGIETIPRIKTDFPPMQYLENAVLSGVVEPVEEGVIIHIYED